MSTKSKTNIAEAFIQFQIEIKRKEIKEFNSVISELEARNQKLLQLDQLRGEQLAHICVLCKQAREQEKMLDQREVVNKEQVEQARQHNLEVTHSKEEELAELNRQLADLQVQVAEQQQEREMWLHYKNVGSFEHQQKIQTLQSELIALQKNFEERSEHIKHFQDAIFTEIDKKTFQEIDEKKRQAKERAIKQLDRSSRQEITENDLLKSEIAVYCKEESLLDGSVRNLEEENLEYTKEAFEHRLNDLQMSRNLFLMQGADLKLIHTSCLEQSVQKLTLVETAELRSNPLPLPDSRAETGGVQRHSVELEKDETNPRCKPSSPPCDLTMLLSGSQGNLREPVYQAPLDQKLLIVVGRAMALHSLPSDHEDLTMQTHLSVFHPKDLSLTTQNIQKSSSNHTSPMHHSAFKDKLSSLFFRGISYDFSNGNKN